MKAKIRGRLHSIFYFLVLIGFAPISFFIFCIANLMRLFLRNTVMTRTNSKNILLTGGKMTKALQLARLLHRSGHKVYLSEVKKFSCSGHAFSTCIHKFVLLPNLNEGLSSYLSAIRNIVKTEKIDLVIPVASPKVVHFDSHVKKALKDECQFVHFDMEVLKLLDDKHRLCETASELDLTAPEVHRITKSKDLDRIDFNLSKKKFILKNLSYDPLNRLDRPLIPFSGQTEYFNKFSFSEKNSWVLQEFIEGTEYCTHSMVYKGKVLLHCCCLSSEFQLRYKHIDHRQIFDWVSSFSKKLGLTGQISFDFIENNKGEIMPIECNPRTHSAVTTFYNSTRLADTYVNPSSFVKCDVVIPREDARETYWIYHELFELFSAFSITRLLEKTKLFTRGKEALFDVHDPLPFLMVYHWQIPLLLLTAIFTGEKWLRIDFNIGKLVEPGGD
ncbi:MAG: ATP-grasp enzyme [Rhodospirillaceae bacterium]|nr:ATP-grasp enzyme [Rhodospirillaceae bacterium]